MLTVDTANLGATVTKFKCRLILSNYPGHPASVEIINFASVPAGVEKVLDIRIAKIRNPNRVISDVNIAINIF
jgi:hypothetical protein